MTTATQTKKTTKTTGAAAASAAPADSATENIPLDVQETIRKSGEQIVSLHAEIMDLKSQQASAAPAPPDAPRRFVLTADLAGQALAKRSAVHDFELPATSRTLYPDGSQILTARVQYVDLSDSDVLTALPSRLLGEVISMTQGIERAEGKEPIVAEDGTVDVQRAIKGAKSDAVIFSAYCVAGFVEPALIQTEGERVRDDQVLLHAIHPADRKAFYLWCQGAEAEATEKVMPFPDGSSAGVAPGGLLRVEGGRPIGAVEDAGAGV